MCTMKYKNEHNTSETHKLYMNEHNTSETHKLYIIKKRSNNKVSFVEFIFNSRQ